MAETNNSEILLESGTNEIEIMEFTVAGNLYGINVAKVDEIMLSQPVKAMPHTHPSVEGIFKPRETVITVLNLPTYLGLEDELHEKDLFIITNYSGYDPEVDIQTGLTSGMDYNRYPRNRSFVFGTNITF